MPKTFDQYREDIERDSHSETQDDTPATPEGLDALTVVELREIAKEHGVAASGLNKAELIDAIRATQEA